MKWKLQESAWLTGIPSDSFLAAMQVNRKYVFTVDQLELIRRLRNSGLTKDQVLTAFDSFERLDNQVGTSLNIPMTLVCDITVIHL